MYSNWVANSLVILATAATVAVAVLIHYEGLRGIGWMLPKISSTRRRKVLFGTNWPMIAPRKALEGLDHLALGADVEQAFLAGNAQRVFSITH